MGEAMPGTDLFNDLAHQIPAGNARVAFSPDGRWLGIGGLAMCKQRMGQIPGARTALAGAMRWRATRRAISREQAGSFRDMLHEAESAIEGTPTHRPGEGADR
jgi:hypothetical protein